MSRPDVSLENAGELYEYYAQHQQNPVFARFIAHPILGKVFRSRITLEEGAEDAIAEEVAANRRLIVSPNHLTANDQFVVVSVAQSVKALRPLRGNTFIPAKSSLFTQPGLPGKALRWAIDELGAVPTTRRGKDVEVTAETEELIRESMLLAHRAQVAKLIKGQNMAVFWEGTRNTVDHAMVQPFKNGPAYTAREAAENVGISVLPVGIYCGGEPQDYQKGNVPHPYTPTIHIGLPIAVENHTVAGLVSAAHSAVQGCVDVAVAASNQ